MINEKVNRRLAAILAADIAGYSRLMGEDEVATVRDLKGHQAAVLPLVAEFGGRIIDTAGDGLLAEFQSAVAAVECATQIQTLMARRNDGVPETRRMQFRIGINLGEVIHDETRIYGDGINVAARLEGIAPPGGICISAKIRDEIEGKLAASFVDMGPQALKNIAKPVQAYALNFSAEAGGNLPAQAPVAIAAPAHRASSRRLLIGAVALVMLLLVAAAVATFNTSGRGAAIGSVAVMPFENATGDPAIDYLSDGISESLINKLSSLEGLRVISRTSAFAFKGKKMSPTEIGRKLGVDALVLGNLSQRGTGLTITTELVSVRNASQLWGDKYSRPADDVLAVEGEIAATIAQTLRHRLSGAEKARLVRSATSNPQAYRLYLKGRDFLVGNQQEMDKSVDYFQQAVAKAPDYAMAHAGLADAYTRQAYLRAAGRAESVGKARTAVTRALELDPDLAEAHTALGGIRFYFDWDWAGAEAEFRRALALNPGSIAVHDDYGVFLTAMGRVDEGLAQSREAARLDPLSVGPVHDIAIAYLAKGDYEQAAAGFRRTNDIDPNWTWGYIKLARTLALLKKCPEAHAAAEIAERKIAGGAAPLSRSWLGAAYATCGDTARARQKLEELHALEQKQYVDPVTFAEIHSALGEIDAALGWYEKAYEARTPNMVYAFVGLRISPELAGSARYKAIVDRMGFPRSGK